MQVLVLEDISIYTHHYADSRTEESDELFRFELGLMNI